MIALAIGLGIISAFIGLAAVIAIGSTERHRPWQVDERRDDADGLHVFDDDDFF